MYFEKRKQKLIQELIDLGIQSKLVLETIYLVDRHNFIPTGMQHLAYNNKALPIESQQFISQPIVVARMIEILLDNCEYKSSILEIGTGSGYNASLLSFFFNQVFSIERIGNLYHLAQKRLSYYSNVHCYYSDGNVGLHSFAPYDAIILTAQFANIPSALFEQLNLGGVMLAPIIENNGTQKLKLYKRVELDKIEIQNYENVEFVKSKTGVE